MQCAAVNCFLLIKIRNLLLCAFRVDAAVTSRVRVQVDRQRREKMTMLATVASIREDIAAVKKDNADTEAHIRERRAAEAASRAQGGALREAHEKACAKYA